LLREELQRAAGHHEVGDEDHSNEDERHYLMSGSKREHGDRDAKQPEPTARKVPPLATRVSAAASPDLSVRVGIGR